MSILILCLIHLIFLINERTVTSLKNTLNLYRILNIFCFRHKYLSDIINDNSFFSYRSLFFLKN